MEAKVCYLGALQKCCPLHLSLPLRLRAGWYIFLGHPAKVIILQAQLSIPAGACYSIGFLSFVSSAGENHLFG